MTRRKCIKILKRRADHLEDRIKKSELPQSHNYDYSEFVALQKAIEIVNEQLQESEEYFNGTISTI